MPEAVELSQTACRYLLTIYELGGGLDAVRSVDVSRRLNVAASSVAHMLGILDREGMIERRRYGRVRLTPAGLRAANRLYTDRILLEAYLREHLGVDGETARLDADRGPVLLNALLTNVLSYAKIDAITLQKARKGRRRGRSRSESRRLVRAGARAPREYWSLSRPPEPQ